VLLSAACGRRASFRGPSLPSTLGCLPYFNAVARATPNESLSATCPRRLGRGREIFPRRKHAAAQKLFSAAMADLLRPVHPVRFAQAKKVPRRFIWRESQIVKDRKSTRLNSSHDQISYAVFCL